MNNKCLFIFIVLVLLVGGTTLTGATTNDTADVNISDDVSFYHRSFSYKSLPRYQSNHVQNVILCIGDGMGYGQITLARLRALGPDGKLHMEHMPITGIMRVHSADTLVTDSAASATALACGLKTNNKVISLTPKGQKVMTILEAAQAIGMKTGLVVTSTLTHATPAVFGAHIDLRQKEAAIAEQLLAHRIHVLFGGGRQYFLPQAHVDSKRKDDLDLIKKAKALGYHYADTPQQLQRLQGPYALGLFQPGPLTTKIPEPSLAELTQKAIDLLRCRKHKIFDQDRGFFLMIEGSQIDWAGHKNDIHYTIRQTLLFDEAVKVALDFATRNKKTLVLVTADHETGGLTVTGGNLDGSDPIVNWAGKHHSALPVPVYAFGPGAQRFQGTYDNTDIPKKIARLLHLQDFPRILSD